MDKFAICGAPYSGVTTLATNMAKLYGWAHLNYSDTLKQHLAEFLASTRGGSTEEWFADILARKDHYRTILQEMGTHLGFDGGFGLQELIHDWIETDNHAHRFRPVILEKIRTHQQADICRKEGFFIVRIEITEDTQFHRAKQLDVDTTTLKAKLAHPIESVNLIPDFSVYGERSVEEMCLLFLRLAGQPVPEPA